MLDIKLIREQTDFVKQGLAKKNVKPNLIDRLLELDRTRRELLQEVELLKAQRNRSNDEIAKAKKEKRSVETIINAMRSLSQKIADIDIKVGDIDAEIDNI